ncbi:MAG: DUF2807 domain-containing protein [Saprospiraceae bacterium]
MKISLTFILIIFSLVFALSQRNHFIELSDNITTVTKEISNFNKVSATDDFKVFITFSKNQESLKIEANENLHEYIIVKKENGVLKLSTQNYSHNHKNSSKEHLVAYITAKHLNAIQGHDDAEIELTNMLKTTTLNIDLDDDAVLKGKIRVDNLTIDLDDDAELDLEGNVKEMKARVNGDSKITGYRLETHNLNIKLMDDSDARLTVTGQINVTARHDSQFTYKGSGKIIKEQTSGDAEVEHKEYYNKQD